MFSNRPPVPPGSGGSYKFTIVETCDRIKEEFSYIQQQNHSLLLERDKLVSERSDMQRICVMYYEMANGMNLEMHRQTEIAKRISAILTQVMPFLSQEHQSQVLSAIDRAKQVSMQELNSVLAAQIEDAKSSKFFNGGNMGIAAEQLEAYKMSVLSGASPSGLQSGPHGLNMSHTGGTSSYISTTSTPTSMAAGGLSASSMPSLSPSNHPTISAALLNGLISVGGIPSGAQGSFLNPATATSLASGRDSDKFTNDEKQRAAAMAAAAAAGSFLFGGAGAATAASRSAANGSSLLPPPNPLAGILGANLADFPGPGFPGAFPPLLSASTGSLGASATTGGAGDGSADLMPSNAMFSSPAGANSGGNVSQQPSRSASAGSGGGSSARHANAAASQLSQNLSTMHATTGGHSSSSGNPHHEEKRRKFNDSRDSTGHENGSWSSAVDFRAASEKSVACNRRSGGSGTQHTSSSSPHLGSDSGSAGVYPTTSSAPAVNSTTGSTGGSSGRSQVCEYPSSRWRSSSKNVSGPGAYSFVVLPGGQTKPCSLASAPGATTAPGLPRRLQHIASLPHGDVVCSVTIGPCPVGRASSLASAVDAAESAAADDDSSSPNPPALSPHFAYTGARGGVKLWDLVSISSTVAAGTAMAITSPLATYDCLCPDSYVRSIKLFPDASSLIIGGESKALTLWDLTGTGRRKAELAFEAPACYALALSSDGKLCYSCCSDGYVSVWDVHNQAVVHQFHGHVDGTSCVELAPDGVRLWTGGLDHKVCCWDIRGSPTRALNSIEFKSQVFSLGLTSNSSSNTTLLRRPTSSLSPSSGDGDSTSSAGPLRDATSPQSASGRNWSSSPTWLAVGLESSEVEVIAVTPDGSVATIPREDQPLPPLLGAGGLSPVYGRPPSAPLSQHSHFRLTHHESCVLALRFAHHGDWFLTTGKDHLVNAWRTPYGACLLETKEAASVLTCDISPDDKFVVTGSGDKRANLYEVIYVA